MVMVEDLDVGDKEFTGYVSNWLDGGLKHEVQLWGFEGGLQNASVNSNSLAIIGQGMIIDDWNNIIIF